MLKLNMKTNIVTNLYLTNINELNQRFLQNEKKSRNLNEKQMIMNINDLDNFTQPIIKFDFYQNGDIKDIYIPNNLEETLFNKLYTLLTNFLPSLKVDDYCNNITEELNKINNKTENDDEEEIEITNENEETENEENEETETEKDVN